MADSGQHGVSFVHPTTGEVIETKAEFDAAIAALEIELGVIYRALSPLREARADKFETTHMPAVRYRTSTQEKVARCPRCGSKLDRDMIEDSSSDSPKS